MALIVTDSVNAALSGLGVKLDFPGVSASSLAWKVGYEAALCGDVLSTGCLIPIIWKMVVNVDSFFCY